MPPSVILNWKSFCFCFSPSCTGNPQPSTIANQSHPTFTGVAVAPPTRGSNLDFSV